MHAIIANQIGRIHHAVTQQDLATTRPVYAYIPEEYYGPDGLDRGRYLASRWPEINRGANPLAVGRHVIPDPKHPADLRSRCPVLREFLARLETIARFNHTAAA